MTSEEVTVYFQGSSFILRGGQARKYREVMEEYYNFFKGGGSEAIANAKAIEEARKVPL
jgi:hypothetical protein